MASVGKDRSRPIGAVHPDSENKGQIRAFQQSIEKKPLQKVPGGKVGEETAFSNGSSLVQDSRRAVSKKLDYTFAFLVMLLILAVYMLTAAPGITWRNGGEDSGELTTAAEYLGVAHPTGYPLYLLLAQPFIRLFVISPDPAARMVFYSAICAALACVLMFFAVLTLLRDKRKETCKHPGEKLSLQTGRWIAAAAALGLGFSPLFWSQAVIAEVYSLEALLLAGTIYLAVLLRRDSNTGTGVNKFYLMGLFLVAGLGAGHHRTLLLSLPGLFLLAGTGTWHKLKWYLWPVGVVVFLTGMMGPYLYQWLRDFSVAESSWGDAWWNFTGQAYQGIFLKGVPGNTPERISAASGTLLSQEGALGLGWLVAFTGLAQANRNKMIVWIALLLPVALHTAFTILYPADNSQVYLIPASIWLVLGVGLGWQTILQNLGNIFKKNSWLVIILFIPAALSLAINWQSTSAANDTTAQDWAVHTLDNVQPDTLIVVDSDAHYFSLWYYRFVKHYRQDVIVIDSRPLGFDWYRANLRQLYPDLVITESSNMDEVLKANRDKRPIEIIPAYMEIG